MIWREWIAENELPRDLFPEELDNSDWSPTTADRQAAWILYTEMRTRIATQPLHFRSGDEVTALTSLYQLFELVRKSIRDHGPECRNFAILATVMLNSVISPFVAKWHKRSLAGDLRSEDVRHEFRAELSQLQIKLRSFQTMFGKLAEGDHFVRGTETAWKVQEGLNSDQVFRDEQRRASDQDAARPDAWWPASVQDQRAFLLGETALRIENSGGEIDMSIFARIDFPPEVARALAVEISGYERNQIQLRRYAAAEQKNGGLPDQFNNIGPANATHRDLNPPSGAEPLFNTVGLALSGGGIRSAAFSLGVLQRLTQQGLLSEVDYLSTVSGGGYTGAFLSSYLNSDQALSHTPPIALAPAALPFRCPDDAESQAVRWIRNRSSYLLFGGWRRKLQIVALAAYGVLINVLVTSPIVVGLASLTKLMLGPWLSDIANSNRLRFPLAGWPGELWFWTLIASGMLALLLAPALMFDRGKGIGRWIAARHQRLCLWIIPAVVLITTINVIPLTAYGVHQLVNHDPNGPAELQRWHYDLALITVAAVLLLLLFAAASVRTKAKKVIGWLATAALATTGPLMSVGFYFVLLEFFVVRHTFDTQYLALSGSWWLLLALTIGPLAYGLLFMNVNLTGPHRFYRDSLSKAFLVQAGATTGEAVKQISGQKLTRLRENNPAAPYHLINTALNVPSSDEPELRGRQSDFFVFSQGYSGSVLSGYAATKLFEFLDPHMDLSTAMTISGAAAAPYMGISTKRSASLLMTLLNVRLGYWMANPWPVPRSYFDRWLRRWLSANAWCLVKELFGWFDHKGRSVNLSDGGHIENLGVYELLRRRCKFIIAIDGEQDSEMTFSSLMRLIRYASIDLNADIQLLGLDDLRLNQDGFSKSHFAMAVIRYQPMPPAPAPPPPPFTCPRASQQDIGVMLYLKSSMSGNEAAPLREYRQRHSAFPHHSTLDQFFDEEQFESYRALGYHVASEALRDEFFNGAPPANLSIRQWFRRLALNLLAE